MFPGGPWKHARGSPRQDRRAAEHSECLVLAPKLRTLLLTASVRIKQGVCPEPGRSGVKRRERAESYSKLLILSSDTAAALGARAAASCLLSPVPFPGRGSSQGAGCGNEKQSP